MRVLAWCMTFGLGAAVLAQAAPKVVSLTPANLAEVDAKTTTELVIVFDQAMKQSGFSICGGGPKFPKITARPKWKDGKTLVVGVELVPEHEYQMSLNCPAARNFRSKQGVELRPVPWSFVTLPTELPPRAKQRRRNEAAWKVLLKTLEQRYSYRDLRVEDWQALEKQHKASVLGARTDRGFAAAAANMLRATEDLHLYLKIGDQMFGTGSRAVDSLFRDKLLGNYMKGSKVCDGVFAGRTDDDIGYLVIGNWTGVDAERIGGAITAMADAKALVVDVRPNAGGSEALAREVAAWFVEGAKVYAKNRYRERAGKNGFGKVLERSIEGHGENRRYDGPVAVLTSRYVMSSNEAFVLMMRQGKDVVTVGQATYGSSGNPKPFELGNGVTIVVPTWQAMRPDGSVFEGEGIEPDEFVPVTVDDLQTRDPILERALELLRARVAK